MQEKAADTLPTKSLSPFQKVAECLYRHKSSGVYYGLVKRGGKQFRRSLKTSDRALANRRLAEFREKMERLSDPEGGRQLFSEVADRWLQSAVIGLKPKSVLRLGGHIRQLSLRLGQVPVRSLSRSDCDDWASLRSRIVAANTFNQERDVLRSVLNYARREGMILDNPAEHLPRRKLTKAALVIPTRVQFLALVQAMRKLDSRATAGADLVELLAYSGMRLQEGVSLRWRDIDFDRGTFTVTGGEQGTKNGEARMVPLFPVMRGFLVALKERNNPSLDDLVSGIASATTAMASACKKSALPEFTHHSLRHFFVSNAIEVGVDFKVIAAWVGHKDGGLLVAKTYGHLRDSHSFEMAKRMQLFA